MGLWLHAGLYLEHDRHRRATRHRARARPTASSAARAERRFARGNGGGIYANAIKWELYPSKPFRSSARPRRQAGSGEMTEAIEWAARALMAFDGDDPDRETTIPD